MKKLKKILTGIIEIALIIVCSFLIVKRTCYEAIVVSQDSMSPTLKDGDFGYVIKTKYALEHIHRFDIVIFNQNLDNGNDKLIKRIIGLPGEVVEFKGDSCDLYINNVYIEQSFIDLEHQKGTCNSYSSERFFQVPEDSYFVLGDNRSISKDSRAFGSVDKSNMIGILKIITGHYETYVDENNHSNKELIPFRYY